MLSFQEIKKITMKRNSGRYGRAVARFENGPRKLLGERRGFEAAHCRGEETKSGGVETGQQGMGMKENRNVNFFALHKN